MYYCELCGSGQHKGGNYWSAESNYGVVMEKLINSSAGR